MREVFTSFDQLISLAKGEEKKSLATFQPREIVDFIIEEDTRTWKEQWTANYDQYNLFNIIGSRRPIEKRTPESSLQVFISVPLPRR